MSEQSLSQYSDPLNPSEVDEFEEINSEEVDRVVEALDHLIEIAQSENIKHYLEEAASSIYFLVYEEENTPGAASTEVDQAA